MSKNSQRYQSFYQEGYIKGRANQAIPYDRRHPFYKALKKGWHQGQADYLKAISEIKITHYEDL